MSIDKVRPLKIESPSEGGTQTDYLPTEVNPSEDYISAKGIVFSDNSNFLIDKIGRTISQLEPYTTFSINYNTNGTPNYVEYFNSDTQITINRIYRTDITYNLNLTPSTETTKIYDTDGTTILRTYTYSFTYSGVTLTNGTVTIT
jgi:hypothetical protein